jgi:hypothetical protein
MFSYFFMFSDFWELNYLRLEEHELDGENIKPSNESIEPVKDAVMFMFAMSSNPHLSTMRFKSKMGKREIYVLFDSRSTYSFVNPNVLQGLKCKVVETTPIVVMVAEGTKVVTDSKCIGLKISLYNQEFSGDLRILNIKGMTLYWV